MALRSERYEDLDGWRGRSCRLCESAPALRNRVARKPRRRGGEEERHRLAAREGLHLAHHAVEVVAAQRGRYALQAVGGPFHDACGGRRRRRRIRGRLCAARPPGRLAACRGFLLLGHRGLDRFGRVLYVLTWCCHDLLLLGSGIWPGDACAAPDAAQSVGQMLKLRGTRPVCVKDIDVKRRFYRHPRRDPCRLPAGVRHVATCAPETR